MEAPEFYLFRKKYKAIHKILVKEVRELALYDSIGENEFFEWITFEVRKLRGNHKGCEEIDNKTYGTGVHRVRVELTNIYGDKAPKFIPLYLEWLWNYEEDHKSAIEIINKIAPEFFMARLSVQNAAQSEKTEIFGSKNPLSRIERQQFEEAILNEVLRQPVSIEIDISNTANDPRFLRGKMKGWQRITEIQRPNRHFDFKITQSCAVMEFSSTGIALMKTNLEEVNDTKSFDYSVLYDTIELFEPNKQRIIVTNHNDKPLLDLLLGSQDVALLELGFDEKVVEHSITIHQRIDKNNLNITGIKKYCNGEGNEPRRHIIRHVISDLVVESCGNMFQKYSFIDGRIVRTFLSQDLEHVKRSISVEVKKTTDKAEAVRLSKNDSFMHLVEIGKVSRDILKGKHIEGWDLSYEDLSPLDLTDTILIDCNDQGTKFPASFDKTKQLVVKKSKPFPSKKSMFPINSKNNISKKFVLDIKNCTLDQALAKLKEVPKETVFLQILGFSSLGKDAVSQISFHLRNLTSLDLSNNGIGVAGAAHIAKFKNITSLILNNNNIGADGTAHLAKLGNLTSLNLSYNGIGADGVVHIEELRNLTLLDLSNNGIGVAGAAHIAKFKNITSLILNNNSIGANGTAHLAKHGNLTSLELCNNDIGVDGAAHIAKLGNLTSLILKNDNIGADGAAHIAKLGNLTSLILKNNNIGADGVAHIAKLGNLTSLSLEHGNIRAAGVAHIAKLGNLTSLELCNIDIGVAGAAHIANLRNLTSLKLSGAKIGNKGIEHITNLQNLTSLVLRNGYIGVAGAAHISKLENLTSLKLSGAKIGNKGIEHITNLRNLISLDLSYNDIEPAGAEYISNLEKLTSLELYCNKIGSKGVEHITKLGNLTLLNLGYNGIEADGAAHISNLQNLTSLDLSGNKIGDKGAEHIAKLRNLRFLDLRNNKISIISEDVSAHISTLKRHFR